MIKKILIVLVGVLIISGCSEEITQTIWEPENMGSSLSIEKISPVNKAFAGYDTLKIFGTNLPVKEEDVFVFIGNIEAEIISLSSNLIKVKIPNDDNLLNKEITIKIVGKDYYEIFTKENYKIISVSENYGNFNSSIDQIFSIAIDNDENLYVMLKGKKVVKIANDGIKNEAFGTTSFPKASDMKIGPDNKIYFQKSNNTDLYVMDITGGTTTLYYKYPSRLRCFDFDVKGRIISAGKYTGVYIKDGNKVTHFDELNEYDIVSIRVLNTEIYLLCTQSTNSSLPYKAIWKLNYNPGDATITGKELVYALSDDNNYANKKFYSLTLDDNDNIYLGTDNEDPILKLQKGSSILEPVYKNLLQKEARAIVWGNSEYLYQIRDGVSETRNLVKINMNTSGAKYNGRTN